MSRLIKKYKNRRLYDTHISRYITIDELQDYVLKDIDFVVKEANQEKDITNLVLMQILVESQSTTSEFLSPLALRQLIKMTNHPMQQTYLALLEQMLANMSSSTEENTHFSEYRKISEFWTKQMEQFFKK